MFTKPSFGWTNLKLSNDFSFPASYLTDIPNDFIKALTIALKNNVSTAVYIDGESKGECLILFDMAENCISTISYNDNTREVREFYNITPLLFAQEFIKSLEDNREEWENWMCEDDYSFDVTPLKKIISGDKK